MGRSFGARNCSLAALAAGDCGFGFVVGFALAFGGALVPLLFALGQREFAFYAALAKVEPGGDKSEALLTGSTFELSNFVLVQQQLACAQRIVVHRVAMREGTDVRVQEKTFSVLQQPVGVLEVGLALANGLDLGAAERDSGLELVEQRIVVASRPVEGSIAHACGYGVAVFGLGRGLGLRGNGRIGERSGHRSEERRVGQER